MGNLQRHPLQVVKNSHQSQRGSDHRRSLKKKTSWGKTHKAHEKWHSFQLSRSVSTQNINRTTKRVREFIWSQMSDQGSGTQIQFTPDSMFQCGNGFMKFYSKRAKVINQQGFQICWWKHEVGGLGQSRGSLAMGLRWYLMAFLALGLAEVRNLFPKDLFHSCGTSGHTQKRTVAIR